MGFFSSAIGNLGKSFGFGITGPQDAANQIALANELAQKEIQGQFESTQGLLQPFISAGTQALPQVQQGTTAGGIDERLGEIFGGGAFQNLVGERTRAVQGQLSAAGLDRSGGALLEAARVPTELGFGLENLIQGRATGLAGQGLSTSLNLGQFGAQKSANIANLISGTGQAQASGILGTEQARAAGQKNLQDTIFKIIGSFAGGGLGGAAGGAAGGISDRRLKQNIVEIGKFNGLKVYKWIWKPNVKEIFGVVNPSIGFIADEVKIPYPEFVSEYLGFDVIDYKGLVDELMEAA